MISPQFSSDFFLSLPNISLFTAVLLINNEPHQQDLVLEFNKIPMFIDKAKDTSYEVRDIWHHKDLGDHTEIIHHSSVGQHDSVFLIVTAKSK